MDQEIESQDLKTRRLPVFLTTVTPLSKALAMVLFIVLPLLGFYLGFLYQNINTSVCNSTTSIVQSPTNISKPTGIVNQLTTPIALLQKKTRVQVENYINDKYADYYRVSEDNPSV